ncbi:hypothetical protein, partial [Acetobacter sp.]
ALSCRKPSDCMAGACSMLPPLPAPPRRDDRRRNHGIVAPVPGATCADTPEHPSEQPLKPSSILPQDRSRVARLGPRCGMTSGAALAAPHIWLACSRAAFMGSCALCRTAVGAAKKARHA